MTTLYLCEKPSQARVLAKELGAVKQENGAFIGNGVIVTYSYGRMLTLATPNGYIGDAKWRMEDLPILPNNWKWEVNPKSREQFDNIGLWLSTAETAVIATDPDDAGEVIGREILKAHGYAGNVLRLWVSALDSGSLRKALNNLLPLSATESYYQAGMIRDELDWLMGMNLSRAFTLINGKTAHIGRVKTQLLTALISRELEIKSFAPAKIFNAKVSICGYDFDWASTSANVPLFSQNGICVSVVDENIEVAAPLPLTLSNLLIHANTTTGISLADGYAAAQTLYEAGVISYPRTSSTTLPMKDAPGFAAHHAIIATMDECPSWADENMRSVFKAVRLNGVFHALGSARVSQRTTTLEFGGQQFKNTTQWTNADEAGWLLRVPEKLNRLTANKPGAFIAGQKVHAKASVLVTESSPPARFTESSVLQMMVDNEIGTEATRIDAITNMTFDKVAMLNMGAFCATSAGHQIAGTLPVGLGQEMSRIVKEAVSQVRDHNGNGSAHLLGATKWLAKVIHGRSVALAQ